MSKRYLVLRPCFVEAHYFAQGQIVNLSDDFPKYEKNFKPMDDDEVIEIHPQEKLQTLATEGGKKPMRPEEVPMEDRPLYVSDKPPKVKRVKK